MLENVVENRNFAKIMQKSIESLIVHFFEEEQHFGILCKIEEIDFNPTLPHAIESEFRPLTLFFLAGYTFETARIESDMLIFEAGFGSENFGSVVSVPLLAILQIIIDETPVFINLAINPQVTTADLKSKEVDNQGVENSMASFLSNPENSKFLK